MVALFAVGVITGTILSFEMGCCGPTSATFGGSSASLRHRGLLVLPGGDLHQDLHLRLGSPVAARAHARRGPDRPHRVQRLAHGHRRQRVDEPSGRFPPRARRGGRPPPRRRAVRQLLPVARARPHVPGGLHRHGLRRRRGLRDRAPARALGPLRAHGARGPADHRRAGLAGAAAGRRLGRAHRGRVPADQARGARGPGPNREGAPIHVLGWYHDGEGEFGIGVPKMLSVLAFHDPNARVRGLDAVAPDERPPSTSSASASGDGRHRDAAGAAGARSSSTCACGDEREWRWFYYGLRRRAAVGRGAHLRLDRDRVGRSRGSSTA